MILAFSSRKIPVRKGLFPPLLPVPRRASDRLAAGPFVNAQFSASALGQVWSPLGDQDHHRLSPADAREEFE